MSRAVLSRRDALLGIGAVAFISGCAKSRESLMCVDTTGLSADDIAIRAQGGYVDRSLEADKTCEACQQYVAGPSSSECGTCKLMKGPVHPLGSCKIFAKKV